ncbi:MAG: sulfotransferase domain-containing protein [Acidimicrobiales bacterium]|nr:sulfotransferase domain-containing protein [Acidimicrobiales bacterium]
MWTLACDSDRWLGFRARDDDIIISTPAKCGTTWTQMLVALLIFDSPELPASLARLSPWVDQSVRPIAEVLADLEAQTHRRFPKSHLPFDALPHDDRITYITVGRDPRDVYLSVRSHFANTRFDVVMQDRAASVGTEDLLEIPAFEMPPIDRVEGFWHWVEHDSAGTPGMAEMLRIVDSFWQRRHEPNVVLLHYAELKTDLVGQMAYLAERLGFDRARARLEELAPAASFEGMKSAAERYAPNADQGHFVDPARFFNKGESGRWRSFLTDDDLPRYDQRVAELVSPELARWLHSGTSQPTA